MVRFSIYEVNSMWMDSDREKIDHIHRTIHAIGWLLCCFDLDQFHCVLAVQVSASTALRNDTLHVQNEYRAVLHDQAKKNTLSQSLREFFKPTRHTVYYFQFLFTSIGLCLHAHPKPKMTEKFQLPYFQKSNGILHVFWAPTCLNSSKTANFLRFS